MKPLIHFAHANGVPSRVYEKMFSALRDEYDVIYVPLLGPDKRYPVDNNWQSLTQQVIDSIVRQAQGRPVIALGHSLGAVLSFQAALQRPELFSQVIMLDPPLIMGKDAFVLHMAKLLGMTKMLDKMSPAGLSKRRRDHWESREQAAESLRPKGFYANFDADCFRAYIDHALMDDPVRGGVQLTISKWDEVAVFRTNSSRWWLPQSKPQVPVHMLAAAKGPFVPRHYPEILQKKMGVPFSLWDGAHMFPLEQPVEVAARIKDIIAQQA